MVLIDGEVFLIQLAVDVLDCAVAFVNGYVAMLVGAVVLTHDDVVLMMVKSLWWMVL